MVDLHCQQDVFVSGVAEAFFSQLTQRSTCGYFLSHVLPQSGAGGQAGRGNDGEGYDMAGLSSQIQQIYES